MSANDDGEDDDDLGFFEDASGFAEIETRRGRVQSLSDQQLLYFYDVLSNPKVILSSEWIGLFEDEIRVRGLRPPN